MSVLGFLAAPIGVAIVSGLALVYLFNMGDCNSLTAEGGVHGACMTRMGVEVPATFDPGKAAAVLGALMGFLAGGLKYLVED